MNQNFDYKNLNSFATIATEKAMLRYSIVVQEKMMSKSFDDLKMNFIGSIKQSAWRWGLKIVIGFLLSRFKSRKSSKR